MTQLSMVAIGGGAIDARKLHDACSRIVQTPDGGEVQHWAPPGSDHRWLCNPISVHGLALLQIEWDPDGPVTHRHNETCWPQCDEHNQPHGRGWAAAIVHLASPSDYRGSGGDSCADAHAYIIREIGRVLDEWERPWKWYDFDTWHDGTESVEALGNPDLTLF